MPIVAKSSLFALFLFSVTPLAAVAQTTQGTSSQAAQSGNGQVVVTIVLEGVRVPTVGVELRDVVGNVVVARSTSDAVGQVAFPDVPPGRYAVHAARDGFADRDSAPFAVGAGQTEQVLVEM